MTADYGSNVNTDEACTLAEKRPASDSINHAAGVGWLAAYSISSFSIPAYKSMQKAYSAALQCIQSFDVAMALWPCGICWPE